MGDPFRDHGGWDMSLQTKPDAIEAALNAWNTTSGTDREAMRAAIDAASALRAPEPTAQELLDYIFDPEENEMSDSIRVGLIFDMLADLRAKQ